MEKLDKKSLETLWSLRTKVLQASLILDLYLFCQNSTLLLSFAALPSPNPDINSQDQNQLRESMVHQTNGQVCMPSSLDDVALPTRLFLLNRSRIHLHDLANDLQLP